VSISIFSFLFFKLDRRNLVLGACIQRIESSPFFSFVFVLLLRKVAPVVVAGSRLYVTRLSWRLDPLLSAAVTRYDLLADHRP
jgi:hypothetical protein